MNTCIGYENTFAMKRLKYIVITPLWTCAIRATDTYGRLFLISISQDSVMDMDKCLYSRKALCCNHLSLDQ